jgi:hypothetical protein
MGGMGCWYGLHGLAGIGGIGGMGWCELHGVTTMALDGISHLLSIR